MALQRTPSATLFADEDEPWTTGLQKMMTPRQSTEESAYSQLKQLSNVAQKPVTPQQRPLRASSASLRGDVAHEPNSLSRSRALNRPSRPVPAKTAAPTTPHALRALERRRAAAASTPGGRRKSGRQQRATPRDILRKLSRVEAATTNPVEPSPRLNTHIEQGAEDNENGIESPGDLPAPRLSFPDDGTDDDSFQAPPRLSLPLDDDSRTVLSVERSRRDHPDLGQYFKGDSRLSDRFEELSDTSEEAADDNGRDARTIMSDMVDGMEHHPLMRPDVHGDTEDLRQILDSRHVIDSQRAELPEPSLDGDFSFAFDIPDTMTDPGINTPVTAKRNTATPPSYLDLEQQSILSLQSLHHEDSRVEGNQLSRGTRTADLLRKSRHGLHFPSIPQGVIKKLTTPLLASADKKSKLNRDVIKGIAQASDWFLEQLGDDLGAYAEHAGKRTIDEADIITLMRRQRLLNAKTTTFSLAQKHLPRELLQWLKMSRTSRTR